jgi:hypothetical protein
VTLTVVDSGAELDSDVVEVTVIDVPDAPEITVLHPIAGEYGIEGEIYEFSAIVSDLQDSPEDLWVTFASEHEDVDGIFCEVGADASGLVACEYALPPGEHFLSLEVFDLDDYSGVATAYFEVLADEDWDDDEDGWTEIQGDCDDDDPSVHPNAEEFYNGVDDDCDGTVDEGTVGYDDDGDGWTELDGDCDDADGDVFPGATELCDGTDNDCDDEVDEDTVCYDDDGDCYCEGGSCDGSIYDGCDSLGTGDCDDGDPSAYPGGSETADAVDNDCDGTVDEGTTAFDDDGDCYCESGTCQGSVDATCGAVTAGDCDDGDDDVSPIETESCNGVDDDCDGDIDEPDASDASTWYPDADADGYGDPGLPAPACTQPSGHVSDSSDCDDSDAAVSPAGTELCNGADDDCDGDVDEDDAADAGTWYEDRDGDGYGAASSGLVRCVQPSGYVSDATDCDDGMAGVNPAASEICDSQDNDCDGVVNEDDAIDAGTWYQDNDGDGFGDSAATTVQCSQPSGHVSVGGDCDDLDASSFPGANEFCDGHDDDCDGSVDEPDAVDVSAWYQDSDGDSYGTPSVSAVQCYAPSGYVSNSDDCDDGDASRNPETTWYMDGDGDGYGRATYSLRQCAQPGGYVLDNTDCDDTRSASHPGSTEYCNGYDDDCDGSTDESSSADASTWYRDADGDGYGSASVTTPGCSQPVGYVSNNTDCYDGNASAYPGATSYHSSPRGDSSYDYNCDGSQSKYYTSSYSCSVDWDGFSCDGYTNGWSGSAPACGSNGTWRSGCSASLWSCDYSSSSSLTQVCR